MPAEDQWSALTASLKQQVADVNNYSSDFGRLRLYSKGLLILLSAIVAADKTFDAVPGFHVWVSIFAVIVAVLTAVDAWIKPSEKWRLSSTYATQFDSLYRKAQGARSF